MNGGDARTRRASRRLWMWRGAFAALAGLGLLVVLGVLSGVYNVVADGLPVSNARFKAAAAWEPTR